MKFVVSELSKCKQRRGTLKEFRNSGPLETPAAMLYTQVIYCLKLFAELLRFNLFVGW